MNKRKVRKIIRFKHDSSTFYKFDKYLKITRVKILNSVPMESVEGGIIYKITYRLGFNFWNPITWMAVLTALFTCMIEELRKILEELQAGEYSRTFKIKD